RLRGFRRRSRATICTPLRGSRMRATRRNCERGLSHRSGPRGPHRARRNHVGSQRGGSVRELRARACMRSAVVVVACAAGMGCTVGTMDISAAEIDEISLERVEGYRNMTRLNARPYMSTLGPFAIN